MCGISGFLNSSADWDRAAGSLQLQVQRHRGPDSDGSYSHGRGLLSQNRLAIIDLETGDPPITNEDGTVGVVLNGEIYNYAEIRNGLSVVGHRFATSGDTEVIAHLAEDLDPVAMARRLDGMFAFAVWDERNDRLVLGRDRLGKKPLYYCDAGKMFVFASEIKGVLAHPDIRRNLEPRAIAAYLTFGYVPTPYTFFSGVLSVPPGHVLVLEGGEPPWLEPYWTPPIPGLGGVNTAAESAIEAASRIRGGLERAVQRRLISDVPLGAFLSGGIDSSAIVAIMAHQTGRQVDTFTLGFDDREGFDERPYARLIARTYQTAHHEEVVHPDAVDLVERLVWHHDQPFGDSSAIPSFLLSEFTKRDVTVALSGDGGDELFGGYERFAAAMALQRYGRLPSSAQRLLHRGLMTLPRRAVRGRVGRLQRFAGPAALGMPDAYRSWLSFVQEPQRRQMLPDCDAWALDDYRRIWESSGGAAPLDRLLNLNLRTYLLEEPLGQG